MKELVGRCSLVLPCSLDVQGDMVDGVASFSFGPSGDFLCCIWREDGDKLRIVCRVMIDGVSLAGLNGFISHLCHLSFPVEAGEAAKRMLRKMEKGKGEVVV